MEMGARRVLDHKAQAVETGNIGNLVAVGNGGGSTARRGHASILGGTDVRRLDMQMPVNKTGSEIATLAVDDLSCLVGASGIVATIVEHADDHTVLDGNATGRHTLAIHVDDLRIGKQRVDGHAPLGSIDHRLMTSTDIHTPLTVEKSCGADRPSPQQTNSHCMPKRKPR